MTNKARSFKLLFEFKDNYTKFSDKPMSFISNVRASSRITFLVFFQAKCQFSNVQMMPNDVFGDFSISEDKLWVFLINQ